MGVGCDLVRLQAREMLLLAIEHAHVGAEEFVRGANQEVAIEGANIDGTVRRVVHSIDVCHGSDADAPYEPLLLRC